MTYSDSTKGGESDKLYGEVVESRVIRDIENLKLWEREYRPWTDI